MLNRKYFPFERNSYYFGKLLTSKDFESEQRYMNDKRRFLNRLSGANGIVAGMGVVMADDASVILQAGCAIDASGREIVVPETKVYKLSTIEGYSTLNTSSAFLGIAYDESPADEVHAVVASEPMQFNKIKEGYKLFLCDENAAEKITAPIDEYVSATVLYSDGDIELIQYTPRFITADCNVSIKAELKRIGTSTQSGSYSYYYDFDASAFSIANDKKTISIFENTLKLAAGESFVTEHTLVPKAHVVSSGTAISIAVTNLTIQKNDEVFTINNKIEIPLKVEKNDILPLFIGNWYKKTMDKTLNESYEEKLWIAKIHLIRQDTSAIIDSVESAPFAQYSYNPQQLMLLRQMEEYYKGVNKGITPPQISTQEVFKQSSANQGQTNIKTSACGVFDMPLGLGNDIHHPLISDEIMHGLGKGSVYIDVGIEYITVNGADGEDSSEIILGDSSIFEQENKTADERIYQVSTAVKVLPERGTFIIGVKLKQTTGLIMLRMRWFAFKLNEADKRLNKQESGARCLLINPDTIVLSPKGTAHIEPVFINMETEACSYKLVDADGGTIDNNGVYTAPAKEGVYEIRIEAVSDPTVYAHVFAIVSQKKKQELKDNSKK